MMDGETVSSNPVPHNGMSVHPLRLRCRQIETADLPEIAALLARGFPRRNLHRWRSGLAAIADRGVPPGRPRFGYVLQADDRLVGTILMFYSRSPVTGDDRVRCNLSSWYVEPEFRPYAALMVRQATNHSDVVYFNISPAPWTLPILAAQGFARYSGDRFFAFPAAMFDWQRIRIEVVGDTGAVADRVAPAEAEALLTASRLGCLSVLVHRGGEILPFAFLRTVVKRVFPAALMVHAPSLVAFASVAGPLGRFLALRGMPLVLIDGDEKVASLPGLHRRGAMPKYCKGPLIPKPWEMVDCEWTIFGT